MKVMNKLINLILSGFLWRKYKFFIVSLVLLVASIWIVGQIHIDYLMYSERQSDAEAINVGYSFMLKWLVYIGLVLLFFYANHLANKKQEKKNLQETKNSSLFTILKNKTMRTSKSPEKSQDQKATKTQYTSAPENGSKVCSDEPLSSDPFEQIRQKDKLRSYADVLIEKKERK